MIFICDKFLRINILKMDLIEFSNLNNLDSFYEFCKAASLETDQPAHSNMWNEKWRDHSETLMFQLFLRKRYSPPLGNFWVLIDKDRIVGCSGAYQSDFSKDVLIAGTRLWIEKSYRNKSLARDYFLPAQKKWALDRNYKAVALTFNDYNKNIIEIWKRRRIGETRSPREPKHIFYENFNEVNHPCLIQHTKQWVIYEILDNDFEFDWNSIRLV